MLLFFLTWRIWNDRPEETVKEKLRRLYGNHTVMSYETARRHMYNEVDCNDNKFRLLYGGNYYDWECGGSTMPPGAEINAEHIVCQSFFQSKTPMVSDLNHIMPAPAKLNNIRSNYQFTEVDPKDCVQWCKDMVCTKTTVVPSNPNEYSCLTNDHKWMPRLDDRGRVSRAVLYFFTMYDYDISLLGDVNTFKTWNTKYAPDAIEKLRNDRVNATQGNRNPYIDDPTLVDQVF